VAVGRRRSQPSPGEVFPIVKAAFRLPEGNDLMADKDSIAADLINWHFKVEPGLVTVYRVTNDNEADPKEPIKLIEVNAQTVATGTFEAYGFAPTREVPFPTLIAEVTPDELVELRRSGKLPPGWDIAGAKQYFPSAA